MIRKLFTVIIVLCTGLAAADRIAILDFNADGLSANQSKTFTDRVRNALVGYTQLDVMEREKFDAIMAEQKIQLSGLCAEDCVVEVGQVAGVQYMVSGDIRDLGDNTTFVAARIIDVETSKLMSSQDIVVKGAGIGKLLVAAPELADALMQQFIEKKGMAAGGYTSIVDQSELGKLKLSVSEGGIQLVIDGRSRGSISRKEIVVQLAAGQHDIQILKDGYEPYSTTVAIQPSESTSKLVTLVATGEDVEKVVDWGFLTISSKPDQAQVVIDGIEYGQTFFQEQISPGKHTVSLSKPLYYSVVKEIELAPGDMLPLDLELKPNYGSVAISSEPTGAQIMLNNRQELSTTPHTVSPIQSGTYSLKVSLQDYRDYIQDVTISDDVQTKVHAVLTPAFGWLNITATPNVAQVFIDGRQIGMTPLSDYRLPSGEYVLSVKADFYKEHQEKILVEDGKKVTLEPVLSPDFGRLSVQGFPEGAKVFVDGELKGTLPCIIEPVAVGSHSIRIDAGPHYRAHQQQIFVGLNDMAGVQANLKELIGSLIVSSNPPGASIRVDGKLLKTPSGEQVITPYSIPKLWVGTHDIAFELNGYATSTKTITLEEDAQELIKVDLQRLIYVKSREQAILRSALLPGFGQVYEGRYEAAAFQVLVQAGLFLWLNELRTEFDPLHDEYLTKRSSYSNYQGSQEEIQTLWKGVETAYGKVETNHNKQQLVVGLMAGAYLWNIADAWIFMPKRTESSWSSGVNADGSSISAFVSVKIP